MRNVLAIALAASLATATAACGADSCFVRGTRVATEDGDVPIEALAVGDRVLSFAHSEGSIVARRVVAVHRSLVSEIRTIIVGPHDATADQPGEPLEATPSHPFWVVSRGEYVPVRDLRVGDELLLRSGRELRRVVVRAMRAREVATPSIEVFNISVESPESNYFAGGVLVHNKEPLSRLCADTETIAGPTSKVADEGTGAARYRFDVTTPRSSSLRAKGYGVRAGSSKADVPLSTLTITGADDGQHWTVEFVVDNGLGVSLVLSGETTTSDGASCSISKTVAALEPR